MKKETEQIKKDHEENKKIGIKIDIENFDKKSFDVLTSYTSLS